MNHEINITKLIKFLNTGTQLEKDMAEDIIKVGTEDNALQLVEDIHDDPGCYEQYTEDDLEHFIFILQN